MKPSLYNEIIFDRKNIGLIQKQETAIIEEGEKVDFNNWRAEKVTQKFFQRLRELRSQTLQVCMQGASNLSESELRVKLSTAQILTDLIDNKTYEVESNKTVGRQSSS